jgi:aminopeptidase YwaD
MKYFLFLSFYFLLHSVSPILLAQDMQRVRKNIATLAAPEMFGRGYIEDGNKKAAHFIAKEFEKLSLQAYTQHRKTNYLQTFKIDVNTFTETPILQIATQKLQAGRDFIIQADSKTAKGTCELFEIDTLLFVENEQALNMFMNTKLDNKALVYASNFEEKIYKLPTIVIRHWFSAAAFIKTSPKLTMNIANNAEGKAVFEVRKNLMDSILLQKRQNNIKIQYEIRQKLAKNYETQNIIAYQKGTSKADSIVVFSAHYDHLGSFGKNTIFYGANDNASGISMLLELATYYSQNPPTFTVVFMAFGAEELGLLGSKYFVENPLFGLEKIKILINLDLVGTGDTGLGVVNATVFTELFQKFATINTQNNYFPKIIKRGKAANSDHYFFSVQGIPSFFIYTLGGIQAYHDVDDKAETLPLTKYTDLFKLLVEWVKVINE